MTSTKHHWHHQDVKVIVHERPMERGAWACHGVVGYYIGPAMKHYRNFNSYIPETKGIRITNTIELFPEKARATEDLAAILQGPHYIRQHHSYTTRNSNK